MIFNFKKAIELRMELNGEVESVTVMLKLQSRKENLEAKIKEKCSELKKLCITEAELTGVIPMEIPLEPGESPPRIRRRVGTMFPYTEEVVNHLINHMKSKGEGKSPKRKNPLGSWNSNSLPHKPSQNVHSPPHYTWSPQRISPRKKPAQSLSNICIHKLKIMKKW